MTFIQLFFIFTAAATLGAALLVVTSRNLIHAALWLIVSLFGVAVFYVILDAGFLAITDGVHGPWPDYGYLSGQVSQVPAQPGHRRYIRSQGLVFSG